MSKKAKDADMLRWIKSNTRLPQALQELVTKDSEFATKLQRLSQYEVQDMRPRHEGQSKSISDIHSFDQVLDVIYQIRCNLFHGQKSMIDSHDKELVELAFYILSKPYKPIIDEVSLGAFRLSSPQSS